MGHREIEVIARGVLIRDGAVLLCRAAEAAYRYVPGGHVEFGESARSAAEREYLEELGARVRVGELLLTMEQRFVQKGKPRHEYTLMFHVEHAEAGDGRAITPLLTPAPAEAGLAFEWWALERIEEAGVLPGELGVWLRTLGSGGIGGDGAPCPGWLSVQAD